MQALAIVPASVSSEAVQGVTSGLGLLFTLDPAECLVQPRPIADFINIYTAPVVTEKALVFVT